MSQLEVTSLGKAYPGTIALRDFTARFQGGKVHAIIGKNGSGKSTLIKVISGAIQPNRGTLRINGLPVSMRSPSEALHQGIAAVYQELSLIPGLSVAENILIGRLPGKGKAGFRIDWKKTFALAGELLEEMGIHIPAQVPVSRLSLGQQQVVEIAKAMSYKPKVLMLDEPTSALAKAEVNNLFALIRRLKDKGVVILYITHRLQELYEIADTVTVLRDGEVVGGIGIKEATPQRIVEMMFGNVEQRSRPADLKAGAVPLLTVSGFTREPHFQDISFRVYGGEILGIAGMMGSGRTELLRGLFGVDPIERGEIAFHGQRISRPQPEKMKELGMAMTPENRKEQGLVQLLTTRANLCLASLKRIGAGGYITRSMEDPYINRQLKELDIKVPDPDLPVSSLSGGNQQKVVIGNWLNTEPRLMLFDEPTRGIDVHAKQQIFQIMWELSRKGIASIFVSSELEELLEVCHRILIMRNGRILQEVLPEETKLEALYSMCMEKHL